MEYLFGDNTSFPLRRDFLDSLRKIVAACAAVLDYQAKACDIAVRRLGIASATAQAEGQLGNVSDAVHALLDKLPAAFPGRPALVARISRETKRACRTVEIKAKRRTSAESTALANELAAAERMLRHTLGPLLVLHELPGISTSRSWEIEPVTARLWGSIVDEGSDGIRVRRSRGFVDPKWPQGSRVAAFQERVRVSVPGMTGFFRKRPGLETWNLGAYTILHATASRGGRLLLLGRDPDVARARVALIVDLDGTVMAQRMDRMSTSEGAPVSLEEIEACGVRRLVDAVFTRLDALGDLREGLVDEVTVDDELVCAEASVFVRRLIASLAPLASEIRRRSPGQELVLKRVLGPGHREELHVAVAKIFSPVAHLSVDDQDLFCPLGHRSPRRAQMLAPADVRETAACSGELQAARFHGANTPVPRRAARLAPPPVPPMPLYEAEMLSFEGEDETTATGRIRLEAFG